jgi:hypothetical protein
VRPSSSARRSASFVFVLVVLALAVCGACRVDVGVGVDVGAGGSGLVSVTATLDRAAVEAVGDVAKELRLDDLRTAGWTVDAVSKTASGGAVVTVSHPFSEPSQVRTLIADVAGGGGPFTGFSLAQQRSFLRTSTQLRGRVDLSSGLGAFSDPALTSALRGTAAGPLGVPDARLLGEGDTFHLTVSAHLPGQDPVTFSPALGGPAVSVAASSRAWNLVNVAALSVAVAAAVALGVVLLRYRQ